VGYELLHADRQTDGRTEGQRDMTKQIFAFRDSAKAPKSVVGNSTWLMAVRETT